jgi:hypothetical protein
VLGCWGVGVLGVGCWVLGGVLSDAWCIHDFHFLTTRKDTPRKPLDSWCPSKSLLVSLLYACALPEGALMKRTSS